MYTIASFAYADINALRERIERQIRRPLTHLIINSSDAPRFVEANANIFTVENDEAFGELVGIHVQLSDFIQRGSFVLHLGTGAAYTGVFHGQIARV